ncbi:hypothetical protein CHUAL_009964 [Chamberlinius hualienensis]
MKSVATILLLAIAINYCDALRCAPCNKTLYCLEEPTSCPYGFTTNICDCCIVCAQGPGELCGGIWNTYGKCGDGLECIATSFDFYEPGICI